MEEEVLTIEDLARKIHKTVNTIRYDMSRRPLRVPPHFKLPGGSRKPFWLKSVVDAWILESARRCGATRDFSDRPASLRP